MLTHGFESTEVQEVLDLLDNADKLVIAGAKPPSDLELLVVTSFEGVEEHIFGNEAQRGFNYVKDREISRFHLEMPNEMAANILRYVERATRAKWPFVEATLAGRSMLFDGIVDLVMGDLTRVLINRLAFGHLHAFSEKMFAIYKSGGCPIGWDGLYPQGKIIACYLPSTQNVEVSSE